MYKIVLLNLPFTETQYPSIALTQLKSVLDEQFGRRVSTEICYLNHDFAHYLGSGLHSAILKGGYKHFESGLAEWFFRQTAFPTAHDNTAEYLQRFYPGQQKQANFFYVLLKKRQGLDAFLDDMIEKYHVSQTQLVGLTSMFSQNLACISLARKLKERNADIVTVMGGANCETPMGEEIAKNVEAVDFVFSGPALISFPQFVEYRLNGDVEACHRISGVFSKVNCLPENTGASTAETDDRKGSTRRSPLPMHANLPQIGPGSVGQERDIYPWSQESLQNLAYYFEDQNSQADYIVTRDKWFGQMAEQVEQWKKAWVPRGETQMVWGKWYQQPHPQLLFKQQGNATLIFDSRSGKPLKYQISPMSKQILQYLDQPHKKADLLKQFAHLSLAEIKQEMAFLQERGLLFEEDDRFLSLVLPSQPSANSPQKIVGTGLVPVREGLASVR